MKSTKRFLCVVIVVSVLMQHNSVGVQARATCPCQRFPSNGPGLLMWLTDLETPQVNFYISPGRGFTRLNLMMKCDGQGGSGVGMGHKDVKLPNTGESYGDKMKRDDVNYDDDTEQAMNNPWYKVSLSYEVDQYTVIVSPFTQDTTQVTKVVTQVTSTTPDCKGFHSFVVRAEGELWASFDCPPTHQDNKPQASRQHTAEYLPQNSWYTHSMIVISVILSVLAMVIVCREKVACVIKSVFGGKEEEDVEEGNNNDRKQFLENNNVN